MTTTAVPELVPARMLNEFAYCPRLCYLEWVQGEFAHSADTIDGRFQHRRVDQPTGNLALPPSPSDDDADAGDKIHARSVTLSDDTLGAIARIDLVEADGKCATPVDYKRGAVPDVPGNAYEPERVQLCIQGLLLRAKGYECRQGVLYFVASRRRVTIEFDDDLVRRTKSLLDETRAMAGAGRIPAPLEDSPKCPRCSLVGICLPDEVTFLKGQPLCSAARRRASYGAGAGRRPAAVCANARGNGRQIGRRAYRQKQGRSHRQSAAAGRVQRVGVRLTCRLRRKRCGNCWRAAFRCAISVMAAG